MDWITIKQALMDAARAMTWIEFVAVIFGILYVVLAAAENIWCWLAALISVSLYMRICWQAELYSEAGLQVFYWIMAVYGWYEWKFGGKKSDELPIGQWPFKYHILNIVGSLLVVIVLGYLMMQAGGANPYLDAFTTVFAIVATFMVARKVLENWIYWVVIDAASIYLYASRELYLTAGLFIAYTIIAAVGYFAWLKIHRTQNA